jgi:predicted RNase H-like HicB family nuclease
MTELVFLIEEDPEGGLTARAAGPAIFTQADGIEELRKNIREAVLCHFEDPESRPRLVRLHFTRDEVLAL